MIVLSLLFDNFLHSFCVPSKKQAFYAGLAKYTTVSLLAKLLHWAAKARLAANFATL